MRRTARRTEGSSMIYDNRSFEMSWLPSADPILGDKRHVTRLNWSSFRACAI
jgi:hypothetical protein